MSLHRLGVVAWLAQPLYLVAELVTATAVAVPYSFADNTISDLGASSCTTVGYPYGDVAVCSPWHLVLNVAFVVTGALMVVGALFIRHPVAGGWVRWLWVVAGLSSVGTGLVPLDRDLDLHSLVALPALVAMPVALVASGVRLRWWVVAGVGVVSLAAAVAFVVRVSEPELGGLFERVAFWPGYVWLGVAGFVALRSAPARSRG